MITIVRSSSIMTCHLAPVIVPDKALAVHIKLVILKMHLRNNDGDLHVYDGNDYDKLDHDNCMVDQDTMNKCFTVAAGLVIIR